ncbi:mannan endo-1,4-beta-mannosidase C [Anaeromyces robustus]|uniref:Mannan endo-1,4-beta-mannosidase C n=1 Tax=Anaeromyces robustus TaxID=1754192 RepID=A0A1Y1WS36_9FUNG|nr:mannan endo-1,4-beta-mannosidase C [Anaeromyces robustus]|eukprot:ORX76272.1 mannan endo-1,4-beta-mannosidase C [Anaeromyces robustus]
MIQCIINNNNEFFKLYYEAEDGILDGVTVFNKHSGYSGTGYVGKFENKGNSVKVKVEVSKTGMYEMSIIYLGNMGKKINTLFINDLKVGEITFPETTTFVELKIGSVHLDAGENVVSLLAIWGWIYIDAFVIEDILSEAKDISSSINPNLVNPNAIPSAKKLYDFLKSNYGKRILSGQVGVVGQAGDESEEFNRILYTTGKTPAVWNMDFIFESNDCTWRPTDPDIIDMAIKWWEDYQGKGIMTAQWHWNIAGQTGDYGFYKTDTTFDIEQAVIEETWEYNKIIKDIDRISGLIKKLQDVNMPIIWRPLHENNGDWFWWGNNPKACAKLWKILYERMVNYHGLNNLIWLWNGNNDEYTPIEYIDLVGVDIYADDHGPQTIAFNTHLNFYKGKKMIVLSENGRIPDIQKCVEQGAWWGYFQTWNSEFMKESHHTDTQLNEYYNNKYVMNMDELPSFNIKSYNDSDSIDSSTECFSYALGYPCCSSYTYAYYSDSEGIWGIEDDNWCGISTKKSSYCWSKVLGYPCCTVNTYVYYIDDNGMWGIENDNWCGIN